MLEGILNYLTESAKRLRINKKLFIRKCMTTEDDVSEVKISQPCLFKLLQIFLQYVHTVSFGKKMVLTVNLG